MNFIKVNLLPYRELAEQRQKKQFNTLMVFGLLAGLGVSVLVYGALAGAVSNQEGRNSSLQAGIKILDEEISEIKKLNEQKRNFLERKQKVEELDTKRFEGARILDTLDQITPEGSYLIALEANAANNTRLSKQYVFKGKAVSDNKVALFMTALPSTGVFDQPELLSIKKTDDTQEFSVQARLVEVEIPKVDQDISASSVAK